MPVPKLALPLNHAAAHTPGGSDALAWASSTAHPSTHGYLGWSLSLDGLSASVILVSGTPQLIKVPTPYAMTVNTITLILNVASVGTIGGQNAIGLYDSTGTRIFSTSTYAVSAAGTLYQVGDTLTQASSTGSGTGFTATVLTVSAGGILTLTTTAPGTGYVNGEVITLTNPHAGTAATITMTVNNNRYLLVDTNLTPAGTKTFSTGGISISTPFVWVAVLNNATTPLKLYTSGQNNAGISNLNLSGATSRVGTLTGSQTALTGSFTPSSGISQGAQLMFTAVS